MTKRSRKELEEEIEELVSKRKKLDSEIEITTTKISSLVNDLDYLEYLENFCKDPITALKKISDILNNKKSFSLLKMNCILWEIHTIIKETLLKEQSGIEITALKKISDILIDKINEIPIHKMLNTLEEIDAIVKETLKK
jgi:hypothetical protein